MEINTEAPVLGAVTIRNGIAYIGGSDHKFRAIDIKSGTVVWSYDGVEGYIETKPLVYDNLVIFGAWNKNLYALDKKTGKKFGNGTKGNRVDSIRQRPFGPWRQMGKYSSPTPKEY